MVTTNLSIQTVPSASTAVTNRERQSVASNGRTQESETTVNTFSTQDDSRRWAHTIASAPLARRAISDERTNGTLKSSETNVSYLNTNFLI